MLLAAPGLARVLCNLPAGALVDRFGRVPCMVLGEVVAGVCCLGTALGSSLGAMLTLRFAQGVGSSMALAGSSAYLADMTERSHLKAFRGTIVGAQGGLIAVAYVVGPAVGGLLSQLYGAQAAVGIVAGLVAACGGAYATLPELSARPPSARPQAGALEVVRTAAADWRALLGERNQQALFAANLALFLNYAATVTVLPLQAVHVFGMSVGGIGALYSVGSVLGVLVSPLAGGLSDRLGRVSLVPPALLGCAVGCFGVAVSQDWEWFVASYMLWSVGEAIVSPVLVAYAADIAPEEGRGSALALSRQSGDLVFFLAPPVLGLLYDCFPGQAAMTCTALLTVVGGMAFRGWARDMVPLSAARGK